MNADMCMPIADGQCPTTQINRPAPRTSSLLLVNTAQILRPAKPRAPRRNPLDLVLVILLLVIDRSRSEPAVKCSHVLLLGAGGFMRMSAQLLAGMALAGPATVPDCNNCSSTAGSVVGS